MKLVRVLMVAAVTAAFSVGAVAEIQSLRGSTDLAADANTIEKHKQMKVKGGIERSFQQQPPMIPHSVEKDKITLKGNTCMKCHSEENHEKEKAPAIGDSHYLDRDGNKLDKLSSRRWFCDQCHAPQADAQPLVQNDF